MPKIEKNKEKQKGEMDKGNWVGPTPRLGVRHHLRAN
jgi:hypothetical protein